MAVGSSTGVGAGSADGHRIVDRLIGNRRTAVAVRRILLWLGVSHFVVILSAAAAAKVIYIDLFLGPDQSIMPYLLPAIPLAAAFHYFAKHLRLQEVDVLVGQTIGFGSVWGALILAFMVLLGGMYLLKITEIYSRGWFLTWFTVSAIGLVVLRWWAMRSIRYLFEAQRLSRYFAIYGTSHFVSALKLRIEREFPFAVVAGVYIDDTPPSKETTRSVALEELQRAAALGAYEKVMIGLPAAYVGSIRAATRGLAPYTPELLLCTELDALPLPVHGSRAIGDIHVQVLSPVPASELHWMPKRVLDCAGAVLGLLLLSPLLLVTAIAIKIDSPGPVFFRQRRYGRNNEVFRIFKFRTMSVAEDGSHVAQARKDDDRVTRVGRILRTASIDEVPQLLNVLLGQMSLVGPRPHALAHEEWFEKEFDLFSRRRRVLPGITGWAQVNGCRGETQTQDHVSKRMEHDLYYIDNWNIWFDIEIMARTLVTVARGAY
jgi:Undecaprenyl-phosphate glucose phosphotransferase